MNLRAKLTMTESNSSGYAARMDSSSRVSRPRRYQKLDDGGGPLTPGLVPFGSYSLVAHNAREPQLLSSMTSLIQSIKTL